MSLLTSATPFTLQASSISKSFTSGRVVTPVLHDITLAIRPGELTLISGPSGCGKSTLLAILSGLQQPDRGSASALGTTFQASTRGPWRIFACATPASYSRGSTCFRR